MAHKTSMSHLAKFTVLFHHAARNIECLKNPDVERILESSFPC